MWLRAEGWGFGAGYQVPDGLRAQYLVEGVEFRVGKLGFWVEN